MADLVKTVCQACNGTGKVDMGPLNYRKIMCHGCNGSGYIMKEKPEEIPVSTISNKSKRGKYAKQGEKKTVKRAVNQTEGDSSKSLD